MSGRRDKAINIPSDIITTKARGEGISRILVDVLINTSSNVAIILKLSAALEELAEDLFLRLIVLGSS